jgi:polyhydroxybutyrate depolymerase
MKNSASRQRLFSALTGAVALLVWSFAAPAMAGAGSDSYGGRGMLVYVPAQLPPAGSRALIVVLHGGLGNAQHIEAREGGESGLNMDAMAEKNGFVVAYLNGTPVTRFMGADKLGWNAGGGCCGVPAASNVDDVGYVTGAVAYLAGKYGIDRSRIYGMGHSNGAMLTQRLMCESNLYAAAVAVSGPLNLATSSCPAAKGKRILAIHGADDETVPVAGGQGARSLGKAVYNSEERSRQTFANSGATYELLLVPGAPHKLDDIDAILQRTEGQTIAEKAARFFGLLGSNH